MKQLQNHKIGIVFAAILILSVTLPGCTPQLNTAIINKYQEETSSQRGWLFTIGDKYWFSKDAINANYEFILKWVFNPSEYENNKKNGKLKAIFLEKTFNQNLIIAQAINDGILNNEEFERYAWIAIKDAIVQYYLRKRIAADNPGLFTLAANDPELNKQVEKLKNIYASAGIEKTETADSIKSSITNELVARKISLYERRVINELKLKNQIRFSK
jgi:hypothetical protein